MQNIRNFLWSYSNFYKQKRRGEILVKFAEILGKFSMVKPTYININPNSDLSTI